MDLPLLIRLRKIKGPMQLPSKLTFNNAINNIIPKTIQLITRTMTILLLI